MPTGLRPENWLDWVILVYVVLGLWQGMRRGLVLSVASIAATVLAVVLAVHYGPQAVSFADAHWHTQTNMEHYMARQMPLPDGSGQVSYSPASAAVLRQDIQQGTPGSAGVAVAQIFASPAPRPAPRTLQGYFDAIVAQHVLGFVGFLAVMIGAEVVLHFVATVLFGRVARRGVVGVVNGGLGALIAAGERLVEVAAILAIVAAVAAVPAAAALNGAIHGSRWAPPLLHAFRAVLPSTGRWISWVA